MCDVCGVWVCSGSTLGRDLLGGGHCHPVFASLTTSVIPTMPCLSLAFAVAVAIAASEGSAMYCAVIFDKDDTDNLGPEFGQLCASHILSRFLDEFGETSQAWRGGLARPTTSPAYLSACDPLRCIDRGECISCCWVVVHVWGGRERAPMLSPRDLLS